MDDRQILIGLKKGDIQAFELLYDLLYPQVRFFTEQIINNQFEAEDIAMEALAKFWKKGPADFESFIQIRAFVLLIAKNAAFDYLRRTKIQKKVHRNIRYMSSEQEENPAERAEQAELNLAIVKALDKEIEKLPGQCRETFKLVFLEHMPRPLVAEKLNITLNTVNSHCANAKNRLKQVFSERELIILLLLVGLSLN